MTPIILIAFVILAACTAAPPAWPVTDVVTGGDHAARDLTLSEPEVAARCERHAQGIGDGRWVLLLLLGMLGPVHIDASTLGERDENVYRACMAQGRP